MHCLPILQSFPITESEILVLLPILVPLPTKTFCSNTQPLSNKNKHMLTHTHMNIGISMFSFPQKLDLHPISAIAIKISAEWQQDDKPVVTTYFANMTSLLV